MSKWGALQPESDRMLHLDGLRFIAAAGVVILHLLGVAKVGLYSDGLAAKNLGLLVDLFFVISGFVIFEIYADRVGTLSQYGNFLKRRLARLGPLHWLTLVIFISLGEIASRAGIAINHPEQFSPQCIPANLLFLQATGFLCPFASFNTPSWSISAEMALYAVFPIIAAVAARHRAAPWLASAAAIVILTTLAQSGGWTFWRIPDGIWRAIPSFLFGCGLGSMRPVLPRVKGPQVWMLACLIAYAAGVYFLAPVLALLALLYAVAFFAVLSDVQSDDPGRAVRLLAAGGQLTYSSYMLHLLVINVLISLAANHVLHLKGVAEDVALVVTFFAVWPISYLSLVYFEQPARRAMSSWRGFRVSAAENTAR